MKVLAVVSQKGGSGKTTLSGHVAVQAELAGDGPVAIVDTDPQGSLAAWWNERETPAPVFVRTTLPELRGHLEELRQAGVRLVVIDTPPAITMAIKDVISVCDYVLVPTRPSPHDLRAVGATVKLVQSCNKPMVFVVNDATPRARITADAAIALSQHGTVAPVTVHHRTDFASSMIDGRTVMELKKQGRSAAEIKGLWEYLCAKLEHEVSPSVFHIHKHPRFEATRVAETETAVAAQEAVRVQAEKMVQAQREAAAPPAPLAPQPQPAVTERRAERLFGAADPEPSVAAPEIPVGGATAPVADTTLAFDALTQPIPEPAPAQESQDEHEDDAEHEKLASRRAPAYPSDDTPEGPKTFGRRIGY